MTPFNTNQKVTLSGAGYGFIRFAPVGCSWQIRRIAVLCSTRVLEARCRTYVGQIGELYVVDGTYSGSSGDTTDTVIDLMDGTPLFVEWSGGDANTIATATISGMQSDPQGGFRSAIH